MIVSMATQEYIKDLIIMLDSLNLTNNDIGVVYLIDCDNNIVNNLSVTYPNIVFERHNKKYPILKKKNILGKKKLVTFLKGEFIHNVAVKYINQIIWIDATTIVNKDLSILYDLLRFYDVALVRRNHSRDFGKSIFCAGLMCFNPELSITSVYKRQCHIRRKLWYADQTSLCKLIDIANIYYLEQTKYLSFNYNKNSYCWADRGIRGCGNSTKADYGYTEKKFIERLEQIKNEKQKSSK